MRSAVGHLIELLSYEFMQNALFSGLLASVLCGILGTFVVLKRLVFISGGISHAAFGGLGICYFMGFPPLWGAAATAVLSALALGFLNLRAHAQDAAIGILWAVGMAIGIVFIYKTPGYVPNLMAYLFGNILMVSRTEVLLTLLLDMVVLGLLALLFKEFVAVAFDEEFSQVLGMPVRALTTLWLLLVAFSVVMLIQVVGIILIIALLTIPPLTSLMLSQDFVKVLAVSVLIGILMTLGGLGLSYAYDIPSGPAMILLGAALMGAVALVQKSRQRLSTR
ncbi:MAG: metal ABC transporter permease [Gammaproteobacteria bacterium]|nr:MAG: metal ABC transporter permease [Gammaproteobacteria bacterium]